MKTTYTILIIDDEKIVRNACRDIIRSGNYHMIAASDGYNGLKLVEEIKPDLVFIDLKMPHMSGLKVLERICTIDPTIVSIVITGYASICSPIEVMQRGAFDYLAKPFTPEEFRAITERGLEKRRLILENITLLRENITLKKEKEQLQESALHIIADKIKMPLSAIQQNLIILLERLGKDLNPNQRLILGLMKKRMEELLQLFDAGFGFPSLGMEKEKKLLEGVSSHTVVDNVLDIMSHTID